MKTIDISSRKQSLGLPLIATEILGVYGQDWESKVQVDHFVEAIELGYIDKGLLRKSMDEITEYYRQHHKRRAHYPTTFRERFITHGRVLSMAELSANIKDSQGKEVKIATASGHLREILGVLLDNHKDIFLSQIEIDRETEVREIGLVSSNDTTLDEALTKSIELGKELKLIKQELNQFKERVSTLDKGLLATKEELYIKNLTIENLANRIMDPPDILQYPPLEVETQMFDQSVKVLQIEGFSKEDMKERIDARKK